jgi:23S rRNA pseudouridine2605 synthase
LLLLTNEGDVAHRLLHPSHAVDREYAVEVEGEVSREALRRLVEGIQLEDGTARAKRVRFEGRAPQGATRLRVVLQEGKKREVRRMMAAIGHPVRRLVRLQYGPIRLGRLGVGEWRRLSEREVAALAEWGGGERGRWRPKR